MLSWSQAAGEEAAATGSLYSRTSELNWVVLTPHQKTVHLELNHAKCSSLLHALKKHVLRKYEETTV